MDKRILTAAVIGYRGHASVHIDLLKKNSSVEISKVFYPKAVDVLTSDLPFTTDLVDLKDCDFIVLSSPSDIHFEQLMELKDYAGYILLEKPAVNTLSQIETMLTLPGDIKERVKVNFNFQHNDLGLFIKRIVNGGHLGKIFSVDVHTSHGGAFKTDWHGAWRIKGGSRLGPLETTGIHYIQFFSRMFGGFEDVSVSTYCLSGRNESVDTGVIQFNTTNNVLVRVRHSYALPFYVRIELFGTDGYFLYDGNDALLFHPRDSFDEKGYFKEPPVKKRRSIEFGEAWSRSIAVAQNSFVDNVLSRSRFSVGEFDFDVKSMRALLVDSGS